MLFFIVVTVNFTLASGNPTTERNGIPRGP